MTVDPEEVAARQTAWGVAADLVAPIVEQHGLEEYAVRTGQPFATPTSTMTKADQHLAHVRDLADWLLGKDA